MEMTALSVGTWPWKQALLEITQSRNHRKTLGPLLRATASIPQKPLPARRPPPGACLPACRLWPGTAPTAPALPGPAASPRCHSDPARISPQKRAWRRKGGRKKQKARRNITWPWAADPADGAQPVGFRLFFPPKTHMQTKRERPERERERKKRRKEKEREKKRETTTKKRARRRGKR